MTDERYVDTCRTWCHTSVMTNTDDRLAALFSRATTPALIQSLRTLDGQTPSPERNQARAWIIGELERRHPAAEAAVAAAFEADNGPVDYVAVLLAAIPTNHA